MKNKLAKILPEGITEDTINKIVELVDEATQKKIKAEIEVLESKTVAFIRTKVDELKEQALKELELENQDFRNVQVLKEIKSLVFSELTKEDEEFITKEQIKENSKLIEEVDLVSNHLNEAVLENNKLQKIVSNLKSKLSKLEEEKVELSEKLKEVKAQKKVPFKSSEKAVMIQNGNGKIEESIDESDIGMFVNEQTLKLVE